MSDDPFGADSGPRPGGPPPPPNLVPPGYLQYGASPSYAGDVQRIGTIATAIRVVLVLVGISSIVSLVTELRLRSEAQDFLAGRTTPTHFENAAGPFLAISLGVGALSLSLIVLQILWSYRIARNLQRFARQPLVWKPGLTIVAWLLGGCTLGIIQFLMLREHWRASDPEVKPGDDQWRRGATPTPIVAWLVTAIAQAVLGVAAGSRSFGGVNVSNGASTTFAQSLNDRATLVVATSALSILATALMWTIVTRLTVRHERLTEAR